MTNSLQNDKDKKFYFNVNIFDEREVEVEPPAPTFSEAELEAARQKSFAEGKIEGRRESDESRIKHIAQILEKIAKETTTLFAAETAREKTYEQESVKLCLAIFQKAFPFYTEKFAVEELKNNLETILRKQEGQKQIIIHVTPEIVDGINEHISKLKNAAGLDLNFSVQGDAGLTSGSTRLAWSDGGAVRNAENMSTQIEAMLKDLLAGGTAKGHDS